MKKSNLLTILFLTLFCLVQSAQAQITLNNPAWKIEGGETTWFGTGNTERGGAYNPATGHVLVVSRAVSPRVVILDAANGDSIGVLESINIAGGTFPINEIGVTEDGQIFAGNLTVDATSSPFKVYRWADEADSARAVFEATFSDGGRYGDAFGVGGSGEAVDVFASGTGNNKIASFGWFGAAPLSDPSFISVNSGEARGGIAAVPGEETIWINGFGTATAQIDFVTGDNVASIPTNVLPTATMDIAFFRIGEKSYIAAGPDGAQTYKVIDVTDPLSPALVAETESLGSTANGNQTGFVAYDSARNHLIVCSTNNAIASYSLEGLMTTNVSNADEITPEDFTLLGNYPNPFNPETVIRYSLPAKSEVTVMIFNQGGQIIRNLISGVQNPGAHKIIWNGRNDHGAQVASGVYIYRVFANTSAGKSYAQSRKMTLLR